MVEICMSWKNIIVNWIIVITFIFFSVFIIFGISLISIINSLIILALFSSVACGD